jgi:hypothetical protein
MLGYLIITNTSLLLCYSATLRDISMILKEFLLAKTPRRKI